MIKYKLTTQNMTTYNRFTWEVGKTVETSGRGELCGPGWLHYYDDPLLAVMFNPLHAKLSNPRLFEAECEGQHKNDKGAKGGCTKMTLLREVVIPIVSNNQRVAFGILCAREVCKDKDWIAWAEKWLANEDRSESAALADYAATEAEAVADAYYAKAADADNATYYAKATAYYAKAAAYYAKAAHYAALKAADADKAAHYTAYCAANAAYTAAAEYYTYVTEIDPYTAALAALAAAHAEAQATFNLSQRAQEAMNY